jgi:hypothetical protein
MSGSFARFAAAAACALSLAACASTPDDFSYGPRSRQTATVTSHTGVSDPNQPMQCVPYARAHSGVSIFGDAYTWWAKSDGQYVHRSEPKLRSVMMLTGYAGPNRAHLAVVSSIVSQREIRVDHANWSNDGAVYIDDPVMDVSPDNDWSEVRIWNIRNKSWGTKTYIVRGFIGPDRGTGSGGSDDPDGDTTGGLVSIN